MSSGHDETPWPIFVISLAAAQERRRAISAQLQALGLPFILFDAIDARQGVPPEYEALIDRAGTQRNLGRPMSSGEYGCALSHLLVYRRICEEGLPGAIVLEDDAVVGPAFKSFVDQQAYRSAPFIQLDHLHARIWAFRPPARPSLRQFRDPPASRAKLAFDGLFAAARRGLPDRRRRVAGAQGGRLARSRSADSTLLRRAARGGSPVARGRQLVYRRRARPVAGCPPS